MAGARRRESVARRPRTVARFRAERRQNLDSPSPQVMGGAMASPMTPPDHAHAFLAESGWGGARIEPLAGDASFRRYFRVIGEGRQAVLMDAPPPHEDPRPFAAVGQWLIEHGLSAPRVLASDLDRGLLLLRDFGDVRFRETVDSDSTRERELHALATGVLVHLHQHPP